MSYAKSCSQNGKDALARLAAGNGPIAVVTRRLHSKPGAGERVLCEGKVFGS